MKNSENIVVPGYVLLIAGAVVLSVISFVLTHAGTILLVVLVVAALYVLGVLLRGLARSLGERAAARGRNVRRTVERTADLARRTAAEDMRTAWIRWQLGVAPPQQRHGNADFIAARLAETPRPDWDATRLRRHGQALWSVRDAAGRTPLHGELEARLDRVAAMLSELTDEDFDTHRGQTDDRYLFHEDSEVRAAYLAGGCQGVESIMGTITAVRAQVQQDAAAKAAADSLARERNAALHALREIRRPIRARSAHADWEAQAARIER